MSQASSAGIAPTNLAAVTGGAAGIGWAAAEIIENRPARPRWYPDQAAQFALYREDEA